MMVTTEAEWVTELLENHHLFPSNILNNTLMALKINGWIIPGGFSLVLLELGLDEKTSVQPYFSDLISGQLSKEEIKLFCFG